MLQTVEFDHANPAISPDLFAWGQRLRADPGLAWTEAHGGFWIASRHADLVKILRDTGTFICSKRITLPPQNSPVPVIPLESDEPDHTFYRSVFQPLLMPKAVAAFEGKLRDIVTDALGPLADKGGGDAVGDFAAKIPTRAMARIFGFSDEDAYRFDDGFSALVSAAGSGDVPGQLAAVDAFKEFLLEKLDQRRRDPREGDLVTAILRHEVGRRTYNEDECLGLMWSAAGGAIDTTKHAIGHAVHLLGTQPDLRRQLIGNPRLIPLAVEESLRLNPSAFMTGRYIARDTELSGTQLKEGQRVLLCYGFGNRDAAMFERPDEVDLDRPGNRLLTFGQGIHHCVGIHLGRFEVKIAVEEFLHRFPDYELETPERGPTLHGGMMWAHDALPFKRSAL